MEPTVSSNNLLLGWSVAIINRRKFPNVGFRKLLNFPWHGPKSIRYWFPQPIFHAPWDPRLHRKQVCPIEAHSPGHLWPSSQKSALFSCKVVIRVKTLYTLSSKSSKNHSSKRDFEWHFFLSAHISFCKGKKESKILTVKNVSLIISPVVKKTSFLIRPAGKQKVEETNLLIKTVVAWVQAGLISPSESCHRLPVQNAPKRQ